MCLTSCFHPSHLYTYKHSVFRVAHGQTCAKGLFELIKIWSQDWNESFI